MISDKNLTDTEKTVRSLVHAESRPEHLISAHDHNFRFRVQKDELKG